MDFLASEFPKYLVGCEINGKVYGKIVTSIKDQKEHESVFSLYSNYPNPFNPSTKIKYSIPASLNPSKGGTLVSLKVYDLLGREVANLVNEEKPSGNYEIEFDGSMLPSGVYFYQLRVSALQSKDRKTNSFVETKKMILLK